MRYEAVQVSIDKYVVRDRWLNVTITGPRSFDDAWTLADLLND